MREYLNYAGAACPECGTEQPFSPAMLAQTEIPCTRCGAVFSLAFHPPETIFLHTANGIVELADGPLAAMLAAHAVPPRLKCLSIDRVHWATFDELIRGSTRTQLVRAAVRLPESSMETAVEAPEIPPDVAVRPKASAPDRTARSAYDDAAETVVTVLPDTPSPSAPTVALNAVGVPSAAPPPASSPGTTMLPPPPPRPGDETSRAPDFRFRPPSSEPESPLNRIRNFRFFLNNPHRRTVDRMIAFALSLLTLLAACLPQLFASPFRRIAWWKGTRLLYFFDRPAGTAALLLALAGTVAAAADTFPKFGRALPFIGPIRIFLPAAYGTIMALGMLELALIQTHTVKILHPTPWLYAVLIFAAATGVFQLLTAVRRQSGEA